MNQRQKSPFLTRRTIHQPGDDPKIKENIGSFIKRRQARIDPNILGRHASSTPNGSDSESKVKCFNPVFHTGANVNIHWNGKNNHFCFSL
jgi:hypothetical protein